MGGRNIGHCERREHEKARKESTKTDKKKAEQKIQLNWSFNFAKNL